MRRLVPALAAAVLLLIGCSDDEPDVAPTASADPAETPPPMPELARDDSPAGAEAFVRHYIDVLNYAALTGDTAALEDLSSAECEGCHSYIDLYDTVYSSGGHMSGGEWSVRGLRPLEDAANSLVVEISAASGSSKMSAEEAEEQHAAYDDELVLSVDRSGDAWSVTSMDRAVTQ